MMLRPSGPHAFVTDDAPALSAWLRSLGAIDTTDGRLELAGGWVRVADTGDVTVGGDQAELAYKMLLFECEE